MATESTPAPRAGQVVPSVLRAGRLLDALAAEPAGATLASLSRQLEAPRSSTLALCNSLLEIGLVQRDPGGAYRLGPHTLELSRAFLGQTDLLSEFRRALAEASFLPAQTLVCAVLRGHNVIYVGNRPGTSPLGVHYETGLRLPAHCTASGLAMLSTLGEAELEELYGSVAEFERLTSKSVSDLGELRSRLAWVRKQGYALDDEETALGMVCIGATVRDDAGAPAGAVAVSMPKGARSAAELRGDAEELRALAERISRALGAL